MSSTRSTSFRGSIRGRGSFQRSHSRAPSESPSTTTPQSIFNAGGDLEAEVEVEGEGGGGGEGGDGVSTEASAVPYGDLPRLITKAELKGKQAVLNTIKGIIKESFHGPWNTYTTAPKEVRQRWWNLFRLRYTWLPGAYPADTEKIMRSAFNTHGSVCKEREVEKDYKEKLLLKKQAASGSGSNSISLDDVAEEELEDDLGLYVEVVRNNKNRVFGRGCETGSSESLSSGGTSHEDYAARLKTELELKLEKKFEAKFQEKSADLEKKYQAQSHDLLSQFQGLKESVNYLTQGLSFQPLMSPVPVFQQPTVVPQMPNVQSRGQNSNNWDVNSFLNNENLRETSEATKEKESTQGLGFATPTPDYESSVES
ncbi:unnamed protein product [Cuscuta campestris]|uniref:Uncharacterized protein n=1 Tax=Cuscuta campestris TaxID=132261 RepID=A0A484MQT9_9ASTE|nr:unnamed protein product [Cuscuta campestris]